LGTRAPRSYRKNTGVYFVRVLIDPVHFDASAKRPKIRELRRSLGTRCPVVARRMSFELNALLEGATTVRREAIVNDFRARSTCGWTLPGISCNGEDDQNQCDSNPCCSTRNAVNSSAPRKVGLRPSKWCKFIAARQGA
jgi:hypothetical protein